MKTEIPRNATEQGKGGVLVPFPPRRIVRREGVPPLPGPKTDVLPREIERQERPARIVPEQ